MTTALLFLLSGVLIVAACELFTNAVEWAGFSLRLGTGATGSLLAAIGTALPETFVPVIALATHAKGADAVATGAVLGSAFLIVTVATAATGLAVMLRRGRPVLSVTPRQTRQDLTVFLIGFSAALVCIVLPTPARVAVGVALLGTYAFHVLRTLRGASSEVDMPEPLHILRWHSSASRPHAAAIAAQLVVAIAILAVASEVFVSALDNVAAALGVPTLILALIVVPLATELPEALNSVLWVRSGDDALAFGNLGGAVAWQATVLAFIGVTFTSWRPGFGGLLGALLTLVTAFALLVALWRGRARGALLILAGLPWLGYVIAESATGGRLGA
ncbi:MAG TPA: sodium:calcium antiporter [Candidatus Dormibacteraeota bacterium]